MKLTKNELDKIRNDHNHAYPNSICVQCWLLSHIEEQEKELENLKVHLADANKGARINAEINKILVDKNRNLQESLTGISNDPEHPFYKETMEQANQLRKHASVSITFHIMETAAQKLEYFARCFTHKANHLPLELEVKQLREIAKQQEILLIHCYSWISCADCGEDSRCETCESQIALMDSAIAAYTSYKKERGL